MPLRPLGRQFSAVLGAVKDMPLRGGLRPSLTAPARGALRRQVGTEGCSPSNKGMIRLPNLTPLQGLDQIMNERSIDALQTPANLTRQQHNETADRREFAGRRGPVVSSTNSFS